MNPRKFLVPAILSFSFAFAPSLNAVPGIVPSSITVPIGGIVFGLPESVFFTGTAQIDVKPSEADAPGAVRRVVVSIDLGELTGRGLSTGASYTAGGLTTLMRVLRPHDLIEATIPIERNRLNPRKVFTGGNLKGSPQPRKLPFCLQVFRHSAIPFWPTENQSQ